MKIFNSLKSVKGRDRNNRMVRRKGRVYIINKKNPKFKYSVSLLFIPNCPILYLFPKLSKHHDEWLGFRPSLPDFLPVIGPVSYTHLTLPTKRIV